MNEPYSIDILQFDNHIHLYKRKIHYVFTHHLKCQIVPHKIFIALFE